MAFGEITDDDLFGDAEDLPRQSKRAKNSDTELLALQDDLLGDRKLPSSAGVNELRAQKSVRESEALESASLTESLRYADGEDSIKHAESTRIGKIAVTAPNQPPTFSDAVPSDDLFGEWDDAEFLEPMEEPPVETAPVVIVSQKKVTPRPPDPPERRKLFNLDAPVSSVPPREAEVPQPQRPAKAVPTNEKITRLRVFRRPPQASYIPVQSADDKFYLRFKNKNWRSDVQNQFASAGVANLISQDAYKKTRALMENARAEIEAQKTPQITSKPPSKKPDAGTLKEMWVERYRAHRYLDLLSDETVNRALLHWLKLWDPIVMDKTPKFLDPFRNVGKKRNREDQNGEYQKKFGRVPEIFFQIDADKRPKFKAALLCGPPGLGKTTLAHVIARHAGYDTLEMNASDDRTLEIFRNRVESSVTNGNIASLLESSTTNKSRPKCLIIDEIDGAPANTVEYLVNLLKGDAKSAAGKKKSKKKLGLWRPVICICNDQYVPALKNLRQITMVLQFPSINRERLTQRLLEICRALPVESDTSVLHSLCEKSDDDIRTCLNTLQFASIEGRRLSNADVNMISMGQKDQRKQLFAVWDSVFRSQSTFRPGTGSDMTKGKDSIGSMLAMVQLGELDKIVSGVYENYLIVKHKESQMVLAEECAEWLVFADVFEKAVMADQNWFLMGYAAFCPVAIHVLLHNSYVPKLNFPMDQFSFYRNVTKNKETVDVFLRDLSPSIFRAAKSSALTSELIPYLVNITQPLLKGSNIQLLTTVEKRMVNEVVDLMITYGLSYREERAVNGAAFLFFDPHLEALAGFPGQQTSPVLSTAVREMIASQVKLQAISNDAGVDAMQDIEEDVGSNDARDETPKLPVSKPTPTEGGSTGKLQVWSVHDYLCQSSASQAPRPVTQRVQQKIWYRYKEGFSNAVCRDVKVKMFM